MSEERDATPHARGRRLASELANFGAHAFVRGEQKILYAFCARFYRGVSRACEDLPREDIAGVLKGAEEFFRDIADRIGEAAREVDSARVAGDTESLAAGKALLAGRTDDRRA